MTSNEEEKRDLQPMEVDDEPMDKAGASSSTETENGAAEEKKGNDAENSTASQEAVKPSATTDPQQVELSTVAAPSDNAAPPPFASEEPAQATAPPDPLDVSQSQRGPPKMRIKLSLRALPTSANRPPGGTATPTQEEEEPSAMDAELLEANEELEELEDEEEEEEELSDEDELEDDDDDEETEDEDSDESETVKATVVEDGVGADEEVVAAALIQVRRSASVSSSQEPTAAASVTSSHASAPQAGQRVRAAPKKRRSLNPARVLRIPPMGSPGLLMTPSANTPKDIPIESTTGLMAPQDLFQHVMAAAGYSYEQRTKLPHRGSSVTRVVGDMFDTEVTLAVRFPPLVPSELSVPAAASASKDKDDGADKKPAEEASKPPLRERLLQGLEAAVAPTLEREKSKAAAEILNGIETESSTNNKKRRKRTWTMADMVPVSLTVPFPKSHLQEQVDYVERVEARERAIVTYQQAQEAALVQGTTPPVMNIPPIPMPPVPPRLDQLESTSTFQTQDFANHHPVYPPKDKANFVAHLDKNCFHVTQGRYFGLYSNTIADPNFCGANAPGISGVGSSGGAGLATATTASSGVLGLTLSSMAAPNNNPALKSSTWTMTHRNGGSGDGSQSVNGNSLFRQSSPKKKKEVSTDDGPRPTSSASGLRKIMEEGGEVANALREGIIRSAVHASRSGRHGQSFVAPNGQTYPDVSKAFAAFGGIKPCERCKNNKQGAYHCRLRRKHKERDYDGSDSPAVLAPFMEAPMESLISAASETAAAS